MRTVAFENASQGTRGRSRSDHRSAALRKLRLRSVALEQLEERALLATLPAPLQTGNPILLSVGNSTITGTNPFAYQRDQRTGNEFSPTISVDPQNSQNMVAVFTRNLENVNTSLYMQPNTNSGPQVPTYIGASYSTDGGATWNVLNLPNPQSRIDFSQDQSGGPRYFAQNTDPSVAFDGQHHFYIIWEAHAPSYVAGEVLLQKYDFTGTVPSRTITNKVIKSWLNTTTASGSVFTPTLVVDDSPPPLFNLLQGPTGLAFTNGGDLLADSANNNQTLLYNGTSGAVLPQSPFASNPTGSTPLSAPGYLAYDTSTGLAFIPNPGNNSVAMSDGTTTSTLIRGASLNNPGGAAFGFGTDLFVVSRVSNQVLRYDSTSGAFKQIFATLNGPDSVAFDASRQILYVSQPNADQITGYDANGNVAVLLNNFATPSNGTFLNSPTALVIGPDNALYIANSDSAGNNNNSVLRYDPTTATLSSFVASGAGGLNGPSGLVFDSTGNLLVSSLRSSQVLRYFGPSSASPNNPGNPNPAAGQQAAIFAASNSLRNPTGLGFDAAGNLDVATGNNQILQFNGTTGAALVTLVDGTTPGSPLVSPYGVLFNAAGNTMFVTTATNAVLRITAATGAVTSTNFAAELSPSSVEVDPTNPNVLYIASASGNMVTRWNKSNGQYLGTVVGNGQNGLSNPSDIAIRGGVLYVSSRGTDQVLKFNATTGAFLGVAAGSASGLDNPEGLAFDAAGNLYVSSDATNSVLKFNPGTGAFLGTYVAPGLGGLSAPRGLLFDAAGNLYVSSFGTNRVLLYTNSGGTASFNRIFTTPDTATFIDPITGVSQFDPNYGNVYVAWAEHTVLNTTIPLWSDSIQLIASTDGGNNFSSPKTIDSQGKFNQNARNSNPRMVVTQERAANPAVYGVGDPGVPGGELAIVWNRFATGNNQDSIMTNRVLAGGAAAFTQTLNASTGFIPDAIAPAGGGAHLTSPKGFTQFVNITDPRFQTVTNVTVTVDVTHPNVGELVLQLVPPVSTGLGPITLMVATTDTNGNSSNPPQGATGANLGQAPGGRIGLTFDVNAQFPIAGQASPAGEFRPSGNPPFPNGDGNTLSAFNGFTAAQLQGNWTLRITDNRNTSNQIATLNNWTIRFTSGLTPGTERTAGNTFLHGALITPGQTTAGLFGQTAIYPLASGSESVVPEIGIGPQPVIAADKTLGSFSPYEGRLYIAYTDVPKSTSSGARFTNNVPADDTDIYLIASDDGGLTWRALAAPGTGTPNFIKVNDDNALVDGFSEGGADSGRPQFQPQLAVDQTTGTLVLSYLDARFDAARSRTAYMVGTSIDGGHTFSEQTWANATKPAVDAITGKPVDIGPILDNQSPGNGIRDTTFNYGYHQSLAAANGHLYAVWSSNQNNPGQDADNNGGRLNIVMANMTYAAGPRIISSTMGPVGLPNDPLNFTRSVVDGGPALSSFALIFDRHIDPASLTPAHVRLFYTEPNGAQHDISNQVSSITPLPSVSSDPFFNGQPDPGFSNTASYNTTVNNPLLPPGQRQWFGYSRFLVNLATPQTAVGSYSYVVVPTANGVTISDRVRSFSTKPQNLTVGPFDAPANQFPSDVPNTGTGGSGTANDFSTTTLTLPADQPLTKNSVIRSGSFITLVLNHQRASDLVVRLTVPNLVTAIIPSGTLVSNSSAPQVLFLPAAFNNSFVEGTYTLSIEDAAGGSSGVLSSWSLTLNTIQSLAGFSSANQMDQDADSTTGEAAVNSAGNGRFGDSYAAPFPTSFTGLFWPGQTFVPGPYDQNTLPLIVPGPHVTNTSVPGVADTADNLVQNRTVDSLDVTFDRNIRVGSLSPAQVLRVMGPAGLIGTPQTYAAPLNFASDDPNLIPINVPANIPDATPLPANAPGQVASSLSIPTGFPIKNLTVSVNITHQNPSQLAIFLVGPGTNPTRVQLVAPGGLPSTPNFVGTFSDAGPRKPLQPLSAFDGASTQGTWTLQILDTSNGSVGSLNSWSMHASQAIPDAVGATPGTLLSPIVIPPTADPITIANMTVNLSLTHPNLSNLSISLISPGPNPVTVPLVLVGNLVGQNLANTSFDDAAPTTLNQGAAPYTGTFRPAVPQALAALQGRNLQGTWILSVVDNTPGGVGTLEAWSLSASARPSVIPSFQAPNVPVNIPDSPAGPVVSTLAIPTSVAGNNFNVKDLKVNLNLRHARTSDLSIALTYTPTVGSPITVQLLNAGAASGANLTDTTFGDDGQFPVAGNIGPYTGTFLPAQALSAFQGVSLTGGTWTLSVTDNTAGGGAGTLDSWTLLATPVDGAAASARTFRVFFPRQELSGTYTVTLGAGITDTLGNALDTNLNAAVYTLFPQKAPTGNTVPVTYQSNNPVTPIPEQAGQVLDSFLTVPDNFQLQGMTVTLNITHPNDPDLTAILMPPGANGDESQGIILFSNVGAVGTRANFVNTTFDDNVFPSTPIGNGSPPFFGSFNPQQALGTFTGKQAAGTWVLRLKDTSTNGKTGSLDSWSLTFKKLALPTGLGEAVADQTTADFRIFTTDPTNPLSNTSWTSVGPASIDLGGVKRSGQAGAIAVDPSDPSGNTVFIGGGSGGIWKTSNFLTTDPEGPTYIPLTDFGPTFGINIGALAVFARNNDPNQSIIFAGTGLGDTNSKGIGFLRSMDGGATWTWQDTINNPPAGGGAHPFATFRSNAFKIVVDPSLNANGGVNVYAAISGDPAVSGIWVSQDTGDTWTRVLAGDATDVMLDPVSGTGINGIDPRIQAPSGTLQNVFAAIRGQGIFENTSQGFGPWNLVARLPGAPSVDPLIQDVTGGQLPVSVPVNNGGTTPNGAKGRIVLAKPFLTQNIVQNQIYQGWLYALVVGTNNIIDGLYLTKDFGQNWTDIQLPINGKFLPSNNETLGQVEPLGGQGNYAVSFAIDPTNPNITYIGGSFTSANVNHPAFIRVDATAISDAHSLVPYDNTRPDGGQNRGATNGVAPVQLKTTTPNPSDTANLRDTATGVFSSVNYFNVIRDPQNQFAVGATLFVTNIASFSNTGVNAKWIPFDLAGSSNQHRLITMVDPLTGHARLILGADVGVFTTVDNNGEFDNSLGAPVLMDTGIGSAVSPIGDRNGNLGITQFYYGAMQPSNRNLLNAFRAQSFYGGAYVNSQPISGDVLANGNVTWSSIIGGTGSGIATDQTGSGTVYRYIAPGNVGTNFFQVQPNGSGAFLGRTFGLTTGTGDPQWPLVTPNYNGQAFGNFAVNPIDGNQIIISSDVGRIFRTENQGGTWTVIGDPSIFGNAAAANGFYAGALAFGAPDPAGGSGVHDNFIYAGNVQGRTLVTTNGGGTWTDISNGLDGSAIQQIIPNPTPGSHDAFAVTLGRTDVASYNADIGPAGIDFGATTGVSTLRHSITVHNTNLNLQDLAVRLDLSYPVPPDNAPPNAVNDLKIFLIAPDGRRFTLMDGATDGPNPPTEPRFGGPMTGVNLTNTTFQASSNAFIGVGSAPYTGTFRFHSPFDFPDPQNNPLTFYKDKNIEGTWTIEITGAQEKARLNSWSLIATAPGGVYYMPDSTSSVPVERMWHNVTGNLATHVAPFVSAEGTVQPSYFTSMAVDWRYTVPNFDEMGQKVRQTDAPVLYVGAEGGVYRTLDDGLNWAAYPSLADGATADGGYLPNAHVTSLQIAVGNVNPTTGRAVATPGSPSTLMASTFGRSSFSIRLAPIVFANTNVFPEPNNFLFLDPASDSGVSSSDNITNDRTPTVVGLSAQSAFGNVVTVRLYDHDLDPNHLNPIGTGQTDPNGKFVIDVTVPFLTDGRRTIDVQATDQSGAQGNVTSLSFTLLATPPPIPATPTLDPASDSGVPGDGITNFNNSGSAHPAPIFDVANVQPGTKVQLFRNGALVNTVVNGPTAGTVQIGDINQGSEALATATPPVAGPPIADGTYVYTVRVTDAAGNTSQPSAGTTVQILASIPPSPTNLTLLSDSGTFNNDAVTSVNNDAAAVPPVPAPIFQVSGIVPGGTVRLLRNGLVVNTIVSAAGGTVQIADTNNGGGKISDNSYTYRAQQLDPAGNISVVSIGLTVKIDSTAPAAPTQVSLDPSTDSGTFNNDGITFFNNSSPSRVPLFNIAGVEAGATVVLFRNGVQVNSVTNTAGGTVQVADTNNGGGTIPDGTYVYTARQIDLAGNVGPIIGTGATVTYSASLPTSTAVKLDAASDTGTSNSDGITQITLLHFPVFDATNITPGATVDLFRNGVIVATLVNTAGGTVQITDANTIPDGTYTYTVRQTDLTGNVGPISAGVSVTYDTSSPSSPSAPVLSPVASDHTSVSNPSFDVLGIEPMAMVKLLRDGAVVATLSNATPTGAGNKVTITDPGPVPNGPHVYTAFQSDLAGNTSPIGLGVTITFGPDTPSGFVLDPASDSGTQGDNITNATRPAFDVSGIGAGSTVRLIRNGNVVASQASPAGGTVTIAEPGPLAPGSYTYTVQQVDASGGASAVSAPLTIVVITSAAAPALALDGNSDTGTKGDGITSDTSPTFALGLISAGATVTLFRNGTAVATLTNAPNGQVTLNDPGPLADGSYNYTAQQTDVAGNISPASNTFVLTVNTTVPTAPTLALDPASDSGTPGDNVTSNTRPTINIAGILPGATVTLSRTSLAGGTQVVRTITNAQSPTASFTEPVTLGSGQYIYTVQQASAAGTPSANSTLTITIDTTVAPPTPAVSLDPASDTGALGDGSTATTTNLVLNLANILPGAIVTVFRNDVPIGTVNGPLGGVATFTDPGPLVAGTYAYTAQQTSAGGTSPKSAVFNLTIVSNVPPPPPRVEGDYSGDRKADLALFYRNPRSSQGFWFVSSYTPNSGVAFGSSTKDIPVLGDFTGDGKADIAVYRPSSATWFVGGRPTFVFGKANVDIPVPGHYDNLPATQAAVYRPTTGQWFIGGHATPITLGGQPGDVPVPADYDGDGDTDLAIFRPGTGQWFIGVGTAPVTFGAAGDIPVPADYDGVGHAELAVFRPGTRQWFVKDSPVYSNVSFGGKGDVPVPADYDGIGHAQIAVFRPSNGNWFIAGHASPIQYGGRHFVPAAAPLAYRGLSGNLSIKSTTATNFGANAAALSTSSVATRSEAKATTPRTTSVFSSTPRVRPNTAVPKQVPQAGNQFLAQRLRARGSMLQSKLPGGPLG